MTSEDLGCAGSARLGLGRVVGLRIIFVGKVHLEQLRRVYEPEKKLGEA
jgi:hypothetical protein